MTIKISLKSMDDTFIIDKNNSPLPNTITYIANDNDLKIYYSFDKGALASYNWISADILLDDLDLVTFWITLKEGDEGPEFKLRFGLLNQVGAKIRIPLDAVNQSKWQTGREGAYLKPTCGGDIVDLTKVDRMILKMGSKGEKPARFSLSDFEGTVDEPPKLEAPFLLRGTICDELGQSSLRDWPTKTDSLETLQARLRKQHSEVEKHQFPESFSKWGGCKNIKFNATGFFRIEQDEKRFWFVDPDGYAFWSMGIDCVNSKIESFVTGIESAYDWLPEKNEEFKDLWSSKEMPQGKVDFFNFLGANFKKTFGDSWHEKWSEITLSMLKRFRLNTVANWSEWNIAQEKTPYVRPMNKSAFDSVPKAFRDLCDVFDPTFEVACKEFSLQLEETKDDPFFIGYFLMNEPTWGFASMTPAEGMLFNCAHGHCRVEFSKWLQAKYSNSAKLIKAWGIETSFEEISDGEWTKKVSSEKAQNDFSEFSSIMVEKLFSMMTNACKKIDPNHLNLGARYYTIPPDWAIAGMKQFDVFSINGYKEKFPSKLVSAIYEAVKVPVIIGEWHFGALDAGLPGNSLRAVKTQKNRGEAYRVYAEGALAHPQCIGIHYFQLYDQSSTGRFDGENWNIGFLDTCNYAYKDHEKAVVSTNERMYQVASGEIQPYESEINHIIPNTL